MNSEKALFAANMLASRFFNKPLIADKVENITVVKWDEIGDMVNALHVLEALHEQFPKARISVLCKPFVATLLEGNPSVHRIVTRMDALPQNSQLWVELRGTWRTLWKSLLSGVQRRLDRGTVRYKQRGNQPHEQITNWRIIEPVLDRQEEIRTQLFIESKHAQSAKDILTKLNLNQFVILHPGGRSQLRRWPAERFGRLAEFIQQNYGIKSLIIGVQEETDVLSEVEKHGNGSAIAYISDQPLMTFAAIIQRAKLFIGNESGPLQIADALGLQSVSIFGPGVEDVFYPRTKGSRIFHEVLECNPCDQVTCVRPESPCIQLIDEINVKEAVAEILGPSATIR